MNKTAMQELILEFEELSKVGENPFIKTTVNLIIDMMKGKLEKEKQQLIDAWNDGAWGGGQFTTTHDSAEEYYKENYV